MGAIAGGVVAGVVALVLGVLLYIMFYRRRIAKEAALLLSSEGSTQLGINKLLWISLPMSLTLQLESYCFNFFCTKAFISPNFTVAS